MATLAAPRQISPLIRFARYAALVSGVIYGHQHMKSLKTKEVAIQEHENKIRAMRAERLKREKEAAQIEEMRQLADQMGVIPR